VTTLAPAKPEGISVTFLDALQQNSAACEVKDCDQPAAWRVTWHKTCTEPDAVLYCQRCMDAFLTAKGCAVRCALCLQYFDDVEHLLGNRWRI
jgi:hypothetical protein